MPTSAEQNNNNQMVLLEYRVGKVEKEMEVLQGDVKEEIKSFKAEVEALKTSVNTDVSTLKQSIVQINAWLVVGAAIMSFLAPMVQKWVLGR